MKRTITFFISALMITAISADDYEPGGDFKVENKLSFHGDANFTDFSVLGAQSVMAGMDFDGDMKPEILFTMDETLPPGGSDPGNVGVYLYESDGSGGYDHVWHFVSPDPGNSLPGVFHGDIDGDGKHEIYFGVPPASSNDATWGTYIFEQGADGTFPTTATYLLRYGMETADNFRPAGYAMADIDGDGKTELATVDRGGRRLSIDALTGTDFDDLATFTNEFMDAEYLGGGNVFDVDIADTDMDGHYEVWVNTWDNFSMTIFEATGTDTYVMAADLNGIFVDNDPGSFNRTGFAFKDVDMDNDHDAWFPMTNGKLYYLDNPALDSIAPNVITNGGVEGGTTGWGFHPDNNGITVSMTGDTLLYETSTSVVPDMNGADSTVYDTTTVLFTASDSVSALMIPHIGDGVENNAYFEYTGDNAIAPGTQFYAAADVLVGNPTTTAASGTATLFAKYFGDGWSWIGMDSKSIDVTSTEGSLNAWTSLETFAMVPAGATIVQVGVMYNGGADVSSIFVDEVKLSPVAGNGVAEITAADFSEVLTFGGNDCRGGDMGDIDGDSKPDFIVGTGTNETVVWIEFVGSDPKDALAYNTTTILSSKGEPLDRYYPLDISETDLDGDGNREVVITNLNSTEASQPQIIVLEHSPFTWDDQGGNAYTHLASNWSRMAVAEKSINDSLFQTDPTGNSRTAIGGMDMDGDGKKEVIVTDYAGGRVIVYEYDSANNAFDVVWSSPVVESRNHAYNPRTVNVGDLDGDGKPEIVFPSSHVDAEGFHIYEWDGVTGSDNYGTTFSSICKTEVDICCGVDGAGFRGDHERIDIFDIDGDGQQELITAIRRGSPRGTLISSLGATDDIEHNSGGGLETWSQEFLTNNDHYGGGSPYQALPADLNGDGKYELVNHHWNKFLFYNISSTGADTYVAPDTGAAAVDAYFKATGNDQVSLFGGNAADIDGDGTDEAYFHSYGSWGIGAGDVWVVDYDLADTNTYEVSGTDTTWHALAINSDHVRKVGNTGTFSGDIGGGYDGSPNKYIFAGRGRPNVSALEYIGPDPSTPQSYIKKNIYWGEMDVTQTKHRVDENGLHTDEISSSWGFPSKVQTQWGGTMLDFDGDGKNELLLSMQNVKDSLKNTNYDWNASTEKYDTTTTMYVNPKAWTVILLENSDNMLSSDDEIITFISPEQYRLSQNYPNPFNPNTTIEYTIPINRKVSVKIYNVNGQLVNTLVNNEFVDAGTHKVMWNGKNNNGITVSTGMYFYSLEWAGMKKVKSMTLLK